MQIQLMTSRKARNSTKIISAATGDPIVSGYLKDQTNIINPVFCVNYNNMTNPNTLIGLYNYLYCAEFHRYYHILNWEYDNGVWYIYCHVDVLATWKTVIGNSEQMITRSGVYGEVDDNMVVGELEPHYIKRSLTDIFSDSINSIGNGTYIVTTAGAPSYSSGANNVIQNTYAMTKTQFADFRAELSSTQYLGLNPNTDDLTDNVAKMVINPFQYVIRCYYIPIAINSLFPGASTTTIKYGWYTLNSVGIQIITPHRSLNMFSGSIPFHPDNQRSMFRAARWSSYSLEYKMIGKVIIPIERLINQTQLSIDCMVDLTSGDVNIVGTPSKNGVMGTPFIITQTNWGIPIPLSSYIRDPYAATDAAANVSSGVGDILKDVFTLNVGGAIDDINSMFKTVTGMNANINAANVQMLGNIGSFSALALPNNGLVLTYVTPSNPSAHTIGVATCQFGAVHDFSGPASGDPFLIVCEKPSITNLTGNVIWLADEYEEIISYMARGFYYE